MWYDCEIFVIKNSLRILDVSFFLLSKFLLRYLYLYIIMQVGDNILYCVYQNF